ncbi:cilia- and flagella-associated protein 157-like [Monodelphis domestica]|uniref:cilia- and flagella-associated protein 157-like n=1 Tax=Monodelphis domestica TaxID=13616 RepID=UPI0024E27779|nr:cilia- and flagella-associated protein 157-like [Monodelphis domestica]
MAPKKKEKKKKIDIQEATKALASVLTETREFYHIQIRDLENRLDRYKKKWEEISEQEKVFQDEFQQLTHNQKEVVSFLKRTLNQRVDEITDLNSQIQGLQISKEVEKDAFEAQLAQVRHEFQETKDQLTMENIMLGGKLSALEDFQFHKSELMSRFSLLEEQLKNQQDEYKTYIYNMERKALIDKERLRKDIFHRMNTVATEFRKFSSSQMAETTKRAIRENMIVALDLAKINSRNLEQLKENGELKESKLELCKQLALLEKNEKNMVKNSLSHIKMIQLLSAKYQEQQQTEVEAEQLRLILSESEIAFQQMEEDNQDLKMRIKNLRKQLKRQKTQGQKLTVELEKERDKRESLEVVLAKATCHLRDLMMVRPEKTRPGEVDLFFHLGKKEMLRQLLTILTEVVIVKPTMPEFVPPPPKSPSVQSFLTSFEDSPQPCEPTTLLQELADIQPYKLGDLGLVPRPPSAPEDSQDSESFKSHRPVKAFSNPEIPSPQLFKGPRQASLPPFHLHSSPGEEQE